MSDRPSLLPPNIGPVERGLEQGIAGSGPDLSPIGLLMDPDTCPAHLLGWLAWAFSVDMWRPDWTEAHKRRVLKDSLAVHRIKGTRSAVETAVASVNLRAEISEWFEHGGDPHTFRVDAYTSDLFADGFDMGPALRDLATSAIDPVKPVRAHYDLRIGETFAADVKIGTAIQPRRIDTETHAPRSRPERPRATCALGTGARIVTHDQVKHRPHPRPHRLRNRIAVGTHARAMIVHREVAQVQSSRGQ